MFEVTRSIVTGVGSGAPVLMPDLPDLSDPFSGSLHRESRSGFHSPQHSLVNSSELPIPPLSTAWPDSLDGLRGCGRRRTGVASTRRSMGGG
jgi:hypothetical protein